MRKLRLDVDDVVVETFTTLADEQGRGTVKGYYTHIDDLCSADCTGIGVECYTADQQYYACSADPCTGPPACTRGTCMTYWPQDETC